MHMRLLTIVRLLFVPIGLSGGISAGAAERESGPAVPLGGGMVACNHVEVFDYFANSWTVVGLKDHPAGVRISPAGDLFLGEDLIVRPLVGKPLRPLNNGIRRTLRNGWLPIVTWSFTINDRLSYTLEVAAAPMNPAREADFASATGENFLCIVRASMVNVSPAPAEAVFALQWRPKGGDIPLKLTEIAPDVHGIAAQDRFFGAARLEKGVSIQAGETLVRARALLEPREHRGICFLLPFVPLTTADSRAHEVFRQADGTAILDRVEAFWRRLLESGAELEVPENKVLETYRASLAYMLISRDEGEVRGGEGFYDEAYIRDGVYQVPALAQAGFLDEAAGSMELLLRRFQRPDGRFESQKDQYDANGYAMWAAVELFELTGNAGRLASVHPAILKAAGWIRQARRQEKDPDSPFFGILPTGIADGEFLWDGGHHIVGYDWQNRRGLLAVARAARILGRIRRPGNWRRRQRITGPAS